MHARPVSTIVKLEGAVPDMLTPIEALQLSAELRAAANVAIDNADLIARAQSNTNRTTIADAVGGGPPVRRGRGDHHARARDGVARGPRGARVGVHDPRLVGDAMSELVAAVAVVVAVVAVLYAGAERRRRIDTRAYLEHAVAQ